MGVFVGVGLSMIDFGKDEKKLGGIIFGRFVAPMAIDGDAIYMVWQGRLRRRSVMCSR